MVKVKPLVFKREEKEKPSFILSNRKHAVRPMVCAIRRFTKVFLLAHNAWLLFCLDDPTLRVRSTESAH